MSDILKASVTDPRGERALQEVLDQDLAPLSVGDLKQRVEMLRLAVERSEAELASRGDAVSAAEALFRK